MSPPPNPAVRSYGFTAKLRGLEIARGYNGMLGGRPEPVIIVALYLRFGSSFQTIGRSLHRFIAKMPFPSIAECDDAHLPSCGVSVPSAPELIALAIALEDDGGDDVQRLFGAVERHRGLMVWPTDSPEAEPTALASIETTLEWALPTPVHVLVDRVDAAESCRFDKWVGAVCWVMQPQPEATPVALRMNFRSRDGRNDWTGLLSAHY